MRTLFLPGKRCWTYFCLIVLFNVISLYFGWTLFENLTRVGSTRRHLSSRVRQDMSPHLRNFLANIQDTSSSSSTTSSSSSSKTLWFDSGRRVTPRIGFYSNERLNKNDLFLPSMHRNRNRPVMPTSQDAAAGGFATMTDSNWDQATRFYKKATPRRATTTTTTATTYRNGIRKIREDNILLWKQNMFVNNKQQKNGYNSNEIPKVLDSNNNNNNNNNNNKKRNTKKSFVSPRSLEFFNTRMDTKELRAFTDILCRFVELSTAHNLTYFLYSGTLLGSYRHHGIIPWDDDMDVMMNVSDKPLIRHVLSSRLPHYLLSDKQGKRWKFYSTLSRPIPGISWSWPYLDISFFRENETHIWDSDPTFSSAYTFLKGDVFPLYDRPFMDSMLPAPKNTGRFLSNRYSMNICKSNIYDHRLERFVSKFMQKSIPCDALTDIYPMVSHNVLPGGVINETLIFKGNIMRWFIRKGD